MTEKYRLELEREWRKNEIAMRKVWAKKRRAQKQKYEMILRTYHYQNKENMRKPGFCCIPQKRFFGHEQRELGVDQFTRSSFSRRMAELYHWLPMDFDYK